MNILSAIILGVVEGVTEFLPVSSTGHMILVSSLLGIANDPFTKSFEIIIQLGAILAVVVLYWKKLWTNKQLSLKVLMAFLPTAIIGLALYKLVKIFLGSLWVVVIALAVGGAVLMFFERYIEKRRARRLSVLVEKPEDVSVRQAIYIGLFQTIAIIPGVSRSAATIVGGELVGVSRKAIVEFSFLLAIPTMFAATALDVYKNHSSFDGSQAGLLVVGLVVAFVVALAAVKSFIGYIQHHSFRAFGIYRVLVAAAFILLFLH